MEQPLEKFAIRNPACLYDSCAVATRTPDVPSRLVALNSTLGAVLTVTVVVQIVCTLCWKTIPYIPLQVIDSSSVAAAALGPFVGLCGPLESVYAPANKFVAWTHARGLSPGTHNESFSYYMHLMFFAMSATAVSMTEFVLELQVLARSDIAFLGYDAYATAARSRTFAYDSNPWTAHGMTESDVQLFATMGVIKSACVLLCAVLSAAILCVSSAVVWSLSQKASKDFRDPLEQTGMGDVQADDSEISIPVAYATIEKPKEWYSRAGW